MRMREINRWQRNCQAHFSYDVFMQLISILRGKALSEEYLEINKKWPHKSLKFKTNFKQNGVLPKPPTGHSKRRPRQQIPGPNGIYLAWHLRQSMSPLSLLSYGTKVFIQKSLNENDVFFTNNFCALMLLKAVSIILFNIIQSKFYCSRQYFLFVLLVTQSAFTCSKSSFWCLCC